jgi:hypothetical protein
VQSKNSLHNLQHDEGGNYMAEAETTIQITIMIDTQQQYINLNIRGGISIIVFMILDLLSLVSKKC